MGAVFPRSGACAENLTGEREVPDHPLVQQKTITDCLTEALDLAGLIRLLKRLESGEIEVVARDLGTIAAGHGGSVGPAIRLPRRCARRTAFTGSAQPAVAFVGGCFRARESSMPRRLLEFAWKHGRKPSMPTSSMMLYCGSGSSPGRARRQPAMGWVHGRSRRSGSGGADQSSRSRSGRPRSGWPSIRCGGGCSIDAQRAPCPFPRGGSGATARPARGLGPVTEARLAEPLGLSSDDITTALTALQVVSPCGAATRR